MSKEEPKPLICSYCYQKLINAGSKVVCPYCSLIFTYENFKDLEAILFTNKEREEMLERIRKQDKEQHIVKEKAKRNER